MNALRSERAMGEPAKQIEAHQRLIIPLDVQIIEEAKKIVTDLGDLVSFYKVPGWLQLIPGADDFVTGLVKDGKQIFWDIKGADIPETMRNCALSAASRQFKFMTIHGNGEVPNVAIEAALSARGDKLKILLVTVLTSLGDDDVRQMYSKYESVDALVEARLLRALDLGVDGVIASGREAAKIRQLATEAGRSDNDFLIVTPGIRPEGADHDDHKRAVTPRQAILNGADYLVVGRPIVQDDNRRNMAERVVEEMQKAFDERAF